MDVVRHIKALIMCNDDNIIKRNDLKQLNPKHIANKFFHPSSCLNDELRKKLTNNTEYENYWNDHNCDDDRKCRMRHQAKAATSESVSKCHDHHGNKKDIHLKRRQQPRRANKRELEEVKKSNQKKFKQLIRLLGHENHPLKSIMPPGDQHLERK